MKRNGKLHSISLLAWLVLLCSCQQINSGTFDRDLRIINAKQQVLALRLRAEGLSAKQQEKLWRDTIEALAPDFYRDVLWGRKNKPDAWQEKRTRDIGKILNAYNSYTPKKIAKTYDMFETETRQVLQGFRQKLPDYNADIQVMIVPGIDWGGSYINDGQHEYLALGVDWFLSQDEPTLNISGLITHELFHDYHNQNRGMVISEQMYRKDGKLFWQLWDEGMATWGMGYVSGQQTVDQVMLLGLGGYARCRDGELAQQFLDEIDNKAIDDAAPVNYKKWFGVRQTKTLGPDTPPMVGYYLGWRVIRGIETSGVSPKRFLTWDYHQARPYIVKQLEHIAFEKC
jgi:hypothetical protein